MNAIQALVPLLDVTMGRHQPAREKSQEKFLTGPDSPPPPGAHPDAAAPLGARSISDARLAEACRRGSIDAYEQLYQMHGAKMKSIARQQLGTTHDAEDVVQEVFLKIHRSIEQFSRPVGVFHLDLPHPAQRVLRRAQAAHAPSGNVRRGTRGARWEIRSSSAAAGSSLAHGARSLRHALERRPARSVFTFRSGRIFARRNSGDDGDQRSGLQEPLVSGKSAIAAMAHRAGNAQSERPCLMRKDLLGAEWAKELRSNEIGM